MLHRPAALAVRFRRHPPRHLFLDGRVQRIQLAALQHGEAGDLIAQDPSALAAPFQVPLLDRPMQLDDIVEGPHRGRPQVRMCRREILHTFAVALDDGLQPHVRAQHLMPIELGKFELRPHAA